MTLRILIFFLLLPFFLFFNSCKRDPEKIYHVQKIDLENELKNKTLIAMGDKDYPPFEYNDINGNTAGFNIDILRSLARHMNLNIVIKLGTWSEVKEKLRTGEIDILAGMFKTSEREKEFDFAIPHFISTYVIFVREGSGIRNIRDIKGKEVIVQEGDLGHDFIKSNGTAGKIITKKDWGEIITALSKGEGDCVIAALLQGTIYIERLGITNVYPLNEPIIRKNYCIAVKNGNAELLAKLNEGLNIIKTSGEYDVIYEKWFSVYEQKTFFSHPYTRMTILLLVVLIFAVSGFYFWNILLKKKIKEKTSALNAELENSNRMRIKLQESLAEVARSKEEALQSKAEAEKSSEAKSFFLAGVSHELRTPLNGIIGMTNLLYNTTLTKEQKDFLDMLKASADNLLRLMSDLLEFSRVASGKFRIEISPVNMNEFLKHTASVVDMLAKDKCLYFKVNNSVPDINLLLDNERLSQIIFNLAGNAVKYTNQGGVTLDVSYDSELHISVSDTGIGMNNDEIEEIFNPFTQINSAGASKNKGLGLGLAIVKLLIETFGGTIKVESTPGRGSRFTLRIPCSVAENTPDEILLKNENSRLLNEIDMTKLSVLIVEDDNISRIYIERLLEKQGLNAEVTGNGSDAVEKIRQKHYDIILMDLNIPGTDGLTAAEIIRTFEREHNVPRAAIIAVTAHAYTEDMEKCFSAGMDGYLAKPFSGRKLMEEIYKVYNKI